jgi:tetratricopeptide (TPR) repeat protein
LKQAQGQYRAFISYSHADRRAVDWLHTALEGYRIPSKLVGTLTPLGPVPARLGTVFRDRDELPAAGDLSAELKTALKRSMFLIVVCSPTAAQSRWVNEEVRQFKLLHGHKRGDGTARVLALIVDGDPGDAGLGNCFPPALRFHVLPDGSISDDPAEPIAADIRPQGDGKKLAKLKLVAGLTGLPLDSLVQREAARRQRQSALLAGASLVLAGVMAVLTVLAVQGRREAERQRAQADGLIEYMLTDLREKLEPVGRLEVLDSVGQKALAYYQAQDLGGLTPDELGRRARALHLVGEVRDLRGDGEAALTAFKEAERTTGELLARDPGNPDRMFDHAQSVFWVGQTAWTRKDWPTTEAKFRSYVELADRMVAADPANAKWQLEQGYAANSLGAFFLQVDRAKEAIPQFQRYVAVSKAQAGREPNNPQYRRELGQAHAWLADALKKSGQFAEARSERQTELATYAAILAADSRDSDVRAMTGRAQHALAEIHLFEGDVSSAIERAKVAVSNFQPLIEQDPENALTRELAGSAANTLAEALLLGNRLDEADIAVRQALELFTGLVKSDPARTAWRQNLMRARWLEIAATFAHGRHVEAREGLARFEADFDGFRQQDIAAGATDQWAMVTALAAVDRLATGDRAAAQARALDVRRLVGADPDAAETAVLSFLAGRLPDPAKADTPGLSAYPADALLGPLLKGGARNANS